MVVIQEINFTFKIESQDPPRNNDIVYFGFVSCDLFRTYCYISKNQLDSLKQDFKITQIVDKSPITEKTTLWTKKIAIAEKKFLNVGLLYIARKQNKHHFLTWKKNPLLQYILSDQPEIFYNIKNSSYSFREMDDFRFSDFYFDKSFDQRRKDNSISYQMKDLSNINQVVEFIFGENISEYGKKVVRRNLLHREYGDILFNYELIRTIFFLKELFPTYLIIHILDNHLDKVQNCKLLKDILYANLHRKEYNFGVIKYLKQFDEVTRFKEMIRFNIPNHILPHFSEAMKEPFDTLRPDLSKESDALYFFNNLSRDWGRLKISNYDLPYNRYQDIVAKIDNKTHWGYSFQVAKDYHTLIQWGSDLRNCAGNHHQSDNYQRMLKIGIFKDSKIRYLITVKGDKYREIDQFKGFKNAIPPEEILEKLFEPFKEFMSDPDRNLNELKKDKGE